MNAVVKVHRSLPLSLQILSPVAIALIIVAKIVSGGSGSAMTAGPAQLDPATATYVQRAQICTDQVTAAVRDIVNSHSEGPGKSRGHPPEPSCLPHQRPTPCCGLSAALWKVPDSMWHSPHPPSRVAGTARSGGRERKQRRDVLAWTGARVNLRGPTAASEPEAGCPQRRFSGLLVLLVGASGDTQAADDRPVHQDGVTAAGCQ